MILFLLTIDRFTFYGNVFYNLKDIFIIYLEIKFLMIYFFRYIKTSGNATVDHLSKYLAVRLALEELRSKGE